jgi:hypothetical protein
VRNLYYKLVVWLYYFVQSFYWSWHNLRDSFRHEAKWFNINGNKIWFSFSHFSSEISKVLIHYIPAGWALLKLF